MEMILDIDDCSSLAPSLCTSAEGVLLSDDDSTIVAGDLEGMWNDDLAAIRKLLDLEGSTTSSNAMSDERCPSCRLPFDKGKKRRLVDSCGHERCYSCLFHSEVCPLCTKTDEMRAPRNDYSEDGEDNWQRGNDTYYKTSLGCSGLRGSEITLYGDSNTTNTIYSRSKVKTNGHFTSIMNQRTPSSTTIKDKTDCSKLPPRPANRSQRVTQIQQDNVMTRSCPTPPNTRKRFFMSPKALRNQFTQKSDSNHGSTDNSALSVNKMTSSTPVASENRTWSNYVLGKIKSLWSAGSSSAATGLNQLADDGSSMVKPMSTKKVSQRDMYTRLGLLLGSNVRNPSPRNSSPCQTRSSHDSSMSMASLSVYESQLQIAPSTNTSPVSTLTGSSEADMHNLRALKDPGSDSVGSLMSMSLSGHSNYSSSPVSRRHSVTTTQQGQVEDVFQNRHAPIRRSAHAGTIKGPVETKIRFTQYRNARLTLKPLFFEVPLQEPDPLFLGRHWLFNEIVDVLSTQSPGILISGNPGTGKTALILQMVEHSCFGRRKDPVYQVDIKDDYHIQSRYCKTNLVSEKIKPLSSSVVAYHFCQADNNATCLVPDFVHSLAAQLCQAPQLIAYREHLLNEPHVQGAVSLKECISNPDLALARGILEPLTMLRRVGKIDNKNCVILIDALCEAEYHRPDQGDTITSFLAKHGQDFPSWLKIIATVRTQLQDVAKQLTYTRINLDKYSSNDKIQKDMLDYINFRLNNSPSIQNNISSISGKESFSTTQTKFSQHLLNTSKGSFLFVKLILDLIERGHLVVKSLSYKVLPVSLAEIFLLHFNLRFPTVHSFDKVSLILSVCLAALYPLTLLEIYYSINCLLVNNFLPWEEFLQRFKQLSGFLVKRLDNTYMFFHPSFREWLIRRDEGESIKFLCDLRAGHAGIAFRLSRIQFPLNPEKTLELGHHILKAHVYRDVSLQKYMSRDLQSYWIASSSEDVSGAICTLRNIYNPNVKVSRLLLLSGASPDYVTDFLGNAPVLCMYSHEGIVPMVSLLLEFGADIELTNNQGMTALSMSASRGHCDIVRQLVAAGAVLGSTDTSGCCALVHASRNGHLNVVSYLLACDWNVKEPEKDVELVEAAQQALVAASSQGHVEIVEYLLDMAEINIDLLDSLTGETALTIASMNGCTPIVGVLISRGANVTIINKKQVPPLLLAVREGHWAIAERLIQHRALLEQTDNTNRTALMLAAAEGHVGLIELLLNKGADLEKQDHEGLTPLCWACLRGRLQATQILLERGSNVNHTDNTGRTPLDLAAFQGNPVLVQLLLDKGALIEHVDINGMRPLDRAIGCRNIQVVQCFLKKGAKLGPATWAMATGKPEIMLILLNKLLEDGNILYRKNRLQEAAHRYQYALRKMPTEDINIEYINTFHQLRINFLLNQSRCKRKMNEIDEAIDLANQVLSLKPESYEAYYARAKARLDATYYENALTDVREALRLAPSHNMEVRKVLLYLRDNIIQKLSMLKNNMSVSNQGILSDEE